MWDWVHSHCNSQLIYLQLLQHLLALCGSVLFCSLFAGCGVVLLFSVEGVTARRQLAPVIWQKRAWCKDDQANAISPR